MPARNGSESSLWCRQTPLSHRDAVSAVRIPRTGDAALILEGRQIAHTSTERRAPDSTRWHDATIYALDDILVNQFPPNCRVCLQTTPAALMDSLW